MEELKPIILGENKEQNLETLKKFYNEVWGVYKKYVENDKLLYKIFKSEHDKKDFITYTRIGILAEMYSASVDNIQDMHAVIDENENNKDNFVFDNILRIYSQEKGNFKLKSFISKYLHWHNEVKNIENATPIYDSNVRAMLSNQYQYLDNYTPNSLNNPQTLFNAIDNFITQYLGKNGTDKVDVEVCGLPTQISTYRLVDKFLWLSYKVIQGEDGKIKEAYEKLYNEVMNKK